jgi:hypothetical protein
MNESERPSGQTSWYVVNANNDVVAGPLADKAAAGRLAEGFGPDHVVQPGAALDPEVLGPVDPV